MTKYSIDICTQSLTGTKNTIHIARKILPKQRITNYKPKEIPVAAPMQIYIIGLIFFVTGSKTAARITAKRTRERQSRKLNISENPLNEFPVNSAILMTENPAAAIRPVTAG